MEIPVDFDEFGYNAITAVKQRIVQRVREGERQRIRDEFEHRVGELLSGEVQQIERGKIVVMLNRARDAEAIIPWKEQNPRERFRQGDSIRAVLKKVEETPKGPRLILSRADPLFVEALFKLEVPEIYQGIVEIKERAREVGGRTKIAVWSRTSPSTRWAPAWASRGPACRPWSRSSGASGSTSCPGTRTPRPSPGGPSRRPGSRR
jgi:transcription termination/antitermination protein NusA